MYLGNTLAMRIVRYFFQCKTCRNRKRAKAGEEAALFAGHFARPKAFPPCPYCGSDNVKEIGREMTAA